MKKFNGTDYDGLLPLAYNALNSQQLDGKTFNEIQNLFTSTDLYLYTGQYTGTGTSGASNPVTIVLPFEPIICFLPIYNSGSQFFCRKNYNQNSWYGYVQLANMFTTNYSGDSYRNVIRKQDNRKKIQWYTNNSTNAAVNQANENGVVYYYAAIGGYDMGRGR